MKNKTHFGRDGADSFLDVFITDAGSAQTLLVCKPNSYSASGAKEYFGRHLADNVVTFSDFAPNPKEEEVLRGVDLFRRNNIQAIVAVGGGSVIDMAKLINYFGNTGQTLDDYATGDLPASVETCPMLAGRFVPMV
ncbi:MAG: iron-containing alcohol dehydrogenase [Bacteroidia bacterium]|nr:iron-containing alcohol dehydrogenase [Bacteroidia bacterium]